MRKLITILVLLFTLLAPLVRADIAIPLDTNCDYIYFQDACGFDWITETCVITYTNGTRVERTRTYPDPIDCGCYIYPFVPCL